MRAMRPSLLSSFLFLELFSVSHPTETYQGLLALHKGCSMLVIHSLTFAGPPHMRMAAGRVRRTCKCAPGLALSGSATLPRDCLSVLSLGRRRRRLGASPPRSSRSNLKIFETFTQPNFPSGDYPMKKFRGKIFNFCNNSETSGF